jgi:hypothetical protein
MYGVISYPDASALLLPILSLYYRKTKFSKVQSLSFSSWNILSIKPWFLLEISSAFPYY